MISYAQALTLYNNITKPPRSDYWRNQTQDNAKPLNGTGQRHKSIHMTDDGVIYFKLYQTKIATLYPPMTDPTTGASTFTAVLRYYNSVTTNKFMSDQRLCYFRQRTKDGQYVAIPYVTGYVTKNSISAVLTYDTLTNRLLVDKSWHPVIGTKHLGVEDKERRAYVRKRLESCLTMLALSTDRLLADAHVERQYMQAFLSVEQYPSRPIRDLRYELQRMLIGCGRDATSFDFDNQEFIEAVMDAAPDFMTRHLSLRTASYLDGLTWHQGFPTMTEAAEHVRPTITPQTFVKSVSDFLFRSFNLDKGTKPNPLPMFKERLPRKYSVLDSAVPAELLNKFGRD
jgi:hypothetical protein